MTNLSPAAQAVLTAATQRLYCLDPEDVPLSASEHGTAIAAALRAAADHDPDGNTTDEYDTGWRAAMDFVDAIAAELDGTNPSESD